MLQARSYLTFIALTSTLSAQVIAVSSVISFDIYRQYFNKHATDLDVIRSSDYGVILFGIFAAAFSIALHYGNANLQWALPATPSIFPTVFTILSSRQSRAAAVLSPIPGMATGVTVWLGLAHGMYSEVTVASSGRVLPCLYGFVASTFSPAVYSIAFKLVRPQRYDWANFSNSRLPFSRCKNSTATLPRRPSAENIAMDIELNSADVAQKAQSRCWLVIASWWVPATFISHCVLWPLPMYASKHVFGKGFCGAWLIVATVWLWGALLIAGFYPIIDSRAQILAILKSLGMLQSRDDLESSTKGSLTADDRKENYSRGLQEQ